jgi:hypothetical protein
MKLDLLDMIVAVLVAFILGMWCGSQWEKAQQRYEDARLSYPSWITPEEGRRLQRYHGTVGVRFYRGTVSIWRDGRWLRVREG